MLFLEYYLTEVLLATFSLLLLCFGAEYNRPYTCYSGPQLITFFYLFIWILGGLIAFQITYPGLNYEPLDDLFMSKYALQNCVSYILLGTLIAATAFYGALRLEKIDSFEYLTLLLLSALGLIILVRANNLLVLYLGVELCSFIFYTLAAYKRTSSHATEAGLKYFLVGAVTSGCFLFSIFLFYSIGGALNYQLIEALFLGLDLQAYASVTQQIALLILISAFLFKLASFPLHLWSIDVYDGAPVASIVFLTTIPKFCFLITLMNILFTIGAPYFSFWQTLLATSGVLSIFWSSFAGIKQKRLKRFLAISSVGNIGFALLGLATGTFQGLIGLFFYMIAYIISSLLAWFFLVYRYPNSLKKFNLNLIDMGSLTSQNSLFGVILLLVLLSFAGIPPLVGFISKYSIIVALFDSSSLVLGGISLFLSLFSGFYYLRITKIIYFENLLTHIKGLAYSGLAAWAISILSLIFFWFSLEPSILITISELLVCGFLS